MVFTANIYGAGRAGWFVANVRRDGATQTVGPHPLPRGRWREFLGLVKQAGFWDLPERLERDPDPDVAMDGWHSLEFAGRHGDRYHVVIRYVQVTRGLVYIERFLGRLCGVYVETPAPPIDTPLDPAG